MQGEGGGTRRLIPAALVVWGHHALTQVCPTKLLGDLMQLQAAFAPYARRGALDSPVAGKREVGGEVGREGGVWALSGGNGRPVALERRETVLPLQSLHVEGLPWSRGAKAWKKVMGAFKG